VPITVNWEIAAALVLILPLIGALLVGARRPRGAYGLAVLFAVGAFVAFIFVTNGLLSVREGEPLQAVWNLVPWLQAPAGLFGFALDDLGIIMLAVVVTIGLLVVIFSGPYLSARNKEHATTEGHGRYYGWLLLFLFSMVGLALSPNLLQMFVFWELTTICSWALISFYDDSRSTAAGFKALVITSAGGAFFALALLLIYAGAHSFDFSVLAALTGRRAGVVFLLLLIAAWAKAAQVPFFTWLPDAMAAPTPISAFLHAAAMVKAGPFLIARVVYGSYGALRDLRAPYDLGFTTITLTGHSLGLIVAFAALITMLVGLYFYFSQDDLKRLLAYSTITHLAYILFGFGLAIAGVWLGFQASMIHLLAHAIAKTLLFLGVGAVAYATGSRSISTLRGLAARMPITALCFGVGVFALIGVPPLACFWGKFFLLAATIQLGGVAAVLLVIFFGAETAVAFYWFLRVSQRVFLGEPAPALTQDPPRAMSGVLIALAILCLVGVAFIIPFLPAAP
jgi:hydrogenase-4 component D